MNFLFMTNNPDKFKEYEEVCGQYAIRCYRADKSRKNNDIFENLTKIGQNHNADQILEMLDVTLESKADLWLIREETNLIINQKNRNFANNHATLRARPLRLKAYESINIFEDGFLHNIFFKGLCDNIKDNMLCFEENIPGIYRKVTKTGHHGFGWDHQFTPLQNPQNFSESATSNIKCCARHLVLGDLLDCLVYTERKDLNFNEQSPQGVIDFSISLRKITSNTVLEHVSHHPFLNRLLTHVENNGIFFRSGNNRRSSHYWNPGLNGGAPLTPKSDAIHESTFLFHDLMHQTSYDLIITHPLNDFEKRVYIIHRMIGEAISLVLADYLFVDSICSKYPDYDFKKRKIWPVFHNLDPQHQAHSNPKILKKLIKYSVNHALRAKPIKTHPQSLFQTYAEKYDRFFISDFVWTKNNIDFISHQLEKTNYMTSWAKAMPLKSLSLISVEDFINNNNIQDTIPKDLVRQIRKILTNNIITIINTKETRAFRDESQNPKAFLRWLCGQMTLFYKFSHIKGLETIRHHLTHYIQERSLTESIDEHEIKKMRDLFNKGLDLLVYRKAISAHDGTIFRDVVPLFPANYQFYDRKIDNIQTLKSTSDSILNPQN